MTFPTPTVIGAAGRAWRRNLNDRKPAMLADWLVHRPGGHPFWCWWRFVVIHLRDVEGTRPAWKESPRATHELSFTALPYTGLPPSLLAAQRRDPPAIATPQDVIPDVHHLSPTDLVYQFHASDQVAAELGAVAARAATRPEVRSPDQDNRSWWTLHLTGTLVHLRGGKHGGTPA